MFETLFFAAFACAVCYGLGMKHGEENARAGKFYRDNESDTEM